MRLLSILTTLTLLFALSLATPLVDVVKNQVQVLGGKGHPEDALIHLIRTDDLLSDDDKQLLERQSHLVFKIHYDEAHNAIFVNGGKIDLTDESIINSDEPLHPGPIVKVESVKLSHDEMQQTDQIKQEHLDKLPKGILAAQLRLKSVNVDENTRRLIVFIKVLEDNGAGKHSQNPVFTLQVTQHPPNPAQEIMHKAKLNADKEAFLGRLKESMAKMHHKVYKIVGIKPANKHHLMLPPPPMVMLKHGDKLVKVPCKMAGGRMGMGMGKHHAHGVHPAAGGDHPHPHPHPHPHHHHNRPRPCVKEALRKAFATLKVKLSHLSHLTLVMAALFSLCTTASLFHMVRAVKRVRARHAYESLPAYDQVEVVVAEAESEKEGVKNTL